MVRLLEVLRIGEDHAPSDVLVVALSRLAPEHAGDRDRALRCAERAGASNDVQALFDYANAPTLMFPWQQPLRALAWHTQYNDGQPPDVIVAISEESWPDYDPYFKPIIEGFTRPILRALGTPDRRLVSTWGEPANFEAFDTVTNRLRHLIRDQKTAGRGSICIDITGGQKTFSAAATVVTVNEDTIISYVRTESAPEHEVLLYDVRDGGVDAENIVAGGV